MRYQTLEAPEACHQSMSMLVRKLPHTENDFQTAAAGSRGYKLTKSALSTTNHQQSITERVFYVSAKLVRPSQSPWAVTGSPIQQLDEQTT
jgi:hypothetical protein